MAQVLNSDVVLVNILYVSGQSIYDLGSLKVYVDPLTGTTLLDKFIVQPYKIDSNGIHLKVGNPLIEGTDYTASIDDITNTAKITLTTTFPAEATHFYVLRATPVEQTTPYSLNIQGSNLKEALENDFTNSAKINQEQRASLSRIEQNNNVIASGIITLQNTFDNLQDQINEIPKNASELPIETYTTLTSTNTQGQIRQVKDELNLLQKFGSTQRQGVKVATSENIDLTNVDTIDGIELILNDRVLVKNQTNKRENGVYVYTDINTLTRSLDCDTLTKISGSIVAVSQGTEVNNSFQMFVDNVNGALDTEEINVSLFKYPIPLNSIETDNFTKQPANTLIGNNENILETPKSLSVAEVKTMLSLNNVDNTSDLNKPISTATQTALDTKVSQVDFDDLEADTQQNFINFQTAIGEKQPLLDIGGNNQFIGFENGIIINRDLNKENVGLANVDNTADLDKPISTAQQEINDEAYISRGNIENYNFGDDLNNTWNTDTIKTGTYFVNIGKTIANLPTFLAGSRIGSIKIIKGYVAGIVSSEEQEVIEILADDVSNKTRRHKRTRLVQEGVYSSWQTEATVSQVQEILSGGTGGLFITASELQEALNTKENTILGGNANEYFAGDKTWQLLSTTNVEEGNKLFFTEDRVRNTKLDGYTVNNSQTTLSTDNVMQALGKKADSFTINNSLNLKANQSTTYTKTEVDGKFNNTDLTGNPTAPTQPATDSSNRLATTEYVKNQITTGKFDTTEVQGVWTKTPSYIQVHLRTKIPYDPQPTGAILSFNIPSGIFTASPQIGTASVNDLLNNKAAVTIEFMASQSTATTLKASVGEYFGQVQQATFSILATQIL